jgi:large subunit ribosomal protein L35
MPVGRSGQARSYSCGCRENQDKSLAKGRTALCFRPLSMQKTKKSIAKRFKLSATGKLVRRTPGFRHLLGAKSTKQKRRASRDKLVAEGQAKQLKRALPFGL